MKIARITKTEAARVLGISRRSVIRYTRERLRFRDKLGRVRSRAAVSQDHRGRVLLSEVSKAFASRSLQGERAANRRPEHRLIRGAAGYTSGYRYVKERTGLRCVKDLLGWAKEMGYVSRGSRRWYVYKRLASHGMEVFEERALKGRSLAQINENMDFAREGAL